MKKTITLLLALAMVFSFVACSSEPAAEEQAEPEVKWKDMMSSVERKTGNRVVIFQNMINFDDSVAEFEGFGGVPEETDGAYPLAIVKNIWSNGVNGELKAIDRDGNETPVNAADLETATVQIQEDGTGILKAGSVEVKNFRYLISADQEALMYVNPEETVSMKDVFTVLGYDACTNVFATASDGYWCCTANAGETEGSEIRGLLSGSVNCNLAVEGKGGAGKINDLFYIDIVE